MQSGNDSCASSSTVVARHLRVVFPLAPVTAYRSWFLDSWPSHLIPSSFSLSHSLTLSPTLFFFFCFPSFYLYPLPPEGDTWKLVAREGRRHRSRSISKLSYPRLPAVDVLNLRDRQVSESHMGGVSILRYT